MAGLLFDRQDHELVALIDAHLARASRRARGEALPRSGIFHPNGLMELAASKALRVAWAVMGLIDDDAPATAQERLDALRALKAEAWSSARTSFRLNTARVLVQLMKELLRARDNTAGQLRLAHDFNKAASGRPRIVRAFLHRSNLLEMPESWNQRAFDYHVHDSQSSGRKSPTHLIMDAWLKGIRTLKVIYDDYAPPAPAAELIAAAEVMDMTIRIGIRFRRFFRGTRVTLVWTPRGFSGPRGFTEFLDRPAMRALIAEGRAIDAARGTLFDDLIAEYNTLYRPELERRFAVAVPALTRAELDPPGEAAAPSWAHLAECIHRRTVAALRAAWPTLSTPPLEADSKGLAAWRARLAAMENFSPETVLRDWLTAAIATGEARLTRTVPRLAEETPAALLERLGAAASDYRASIDTRNLTAAQVLQLLHLCRGRITHLEMFQLRTFTPGDLPHLAEMNALRGTINSGNPARLKRLVKATLAATPRAAGDDIACLGELLDHMRELMAPYRHRPLSAFVGSGSSGRSDWGAQRGMGFAIVETLPLSGQRACTRPGTSRQLPLRYALRETIARDLGPAVAARARFATRPALGWCVYWLWRLAALFTASRRDWTAPLESLEIVPSGNVLALGGAGAFSGNHLAGTPPAPRVPLRPYLNTLFVDIAFVASGFAAALGAFLLTQTGVLALWGAPLWFLITGVRNILQAVISGGGLTRQSDLRWKDYVSWTRFSESLFYTGLSVPLLEGGVRYLLLERGFGLTASGHPVTVFLAIAVVNGLYVMAHNLYRGLPRAEAYANLGRSVAAVPVAVLYGALLGLLLRLAGVAEAATWVAAASTLVSKAASDSVAAGVEGYFDRRATARLRRLDLGEVLAALFDGQAALELCFPRQEAVDLLRHPAALLHSERREVRRIAAEIAIHCLDLMYFHFAQPLAPQSFDAMAARLPPQDRAFLHAATGLLDGEDDIARLLAGEAFALPPERALAFYRSHHRRFRAALPPPDGTTASKKESPSFS